MYARRLCLSFGLLLAGLGSAAGSASAENGVLLDEASYWRHYCRFGPSRISAEALAVEGEKVLGRGGLGRAKAEAVKRMRQQGIDSAREDWKAHVRLRVYRELSAGQGPSPDWAKVDFDDAAWPLRRHTFAGGIPPGSAQFLDRGIVSAFYRGRFVVRDLRRAGNLTLTAAYHGGLRILVNGVEVARKHLPDGALAPDAPAQSYPLAAYQRSGPSQWRRTLGPVTVPAKLLRGGTNLLAVEIHASRFHPILLTNPRQRNWCDPQRPWPHAQVLELSLKTDQPGALGKCERPLGVQVWVQDVHHRTESTEFLPPGESMGVARVVGARNGTYSAQIVIGTSKDLTGLRVTTNPLSQAGGTAQLPASCVGVSFAAPFPAKEFSRAKLGDERGLGGSFPSNRRLAALEQMTEPGKPYVFDHLSPTPPARIPADTCRPVWLSVRIPPDAAAGRYRGQVVIQANEIKPIALPVHAEVLDWRLPDAKDFQTVVACEENPYAVARQYNVALWSQEHLRRIETSFRQLARVGSRWLNVPVLRRTEFGNRDDSMIRWTRRKDGSLTFDFFILDRYLGLAVKHWGRKPYVNFVVLHGTKSRPPVPPEVMVLDQARGKAEPLNVKGPPGDKERVWTALGKSLDEHMTQRGLKGYWYWGFPADGEEEDPQLKKILAKAVPGVRWAVCPHALLMNMKYTQDRGGFYGAFLVPRYWGDWSRLRNEMGWKSTTLHLLSPRVDGTCLAMCTTSHPMVYRIVTDQALARGRNGIARIAADGWASAYFDGMAPRIWITGLPVLFTLWPGAKGAESSARHEALLEGLQETEARIFLEQALDRKQLPGQLAKKAKDLLARRLAETTIFQPNILVPELEKYHHGWQRRSRDLYQLAAQAAAAMTTTPK